MDKNLKLKIAKIDEIFQLDFERDNKFFIDPYRINDRESELLKRAKEKIIIYFDEFFNLVKTRARKEVEELGKYLHEINATKLGYTKKENKPNGKGFSKRDLLIIFDEAVKVTKKISDMPDILILAKNVGPDKVSDLTTNIIYEELLEFTIYIIKKYDLDINTIKKKKWIFNIFTKSWERKELNIPVIDNEEILFIPQKIVAKYQVFSYENVYRTLVFPFYKIHTAIHRLVRLLKSGEEIADCKKLRKRYPKSRSTIIEFKENYPQEYSEYKEKMQNDYWRQ